MYLSLAGIVLAGLVVFKEDGEISLNALWIAHLAAPI
jgi:hypothetical protein